MSRTITADKLNDLEGAVLIDIRDSSAFEYGHISGAVNIPQEQVLTAELPRDKKIVIYCKSGIISGDIADRLCDKGYDAYDPKTNLRYQIKSRWERESATTQSRELNVIRNYDDNQFDYLVVVIFDAHFGVKEAYMVPHHSIKRYAHYNRHQNGYILVARGAVLTNDETRNISVELR